ncbi:hypothetical protein Fmac_014605 [Flemingia macrophylla]|uniref:Protein kinase domain-containing protein n=1 Tax=Flemingia macrophylla TaxID=520843 RepID=A0ABD1MCR6_9FABA
MASGMGDEIVENTDMTDDAISYIERVDSLIRSETDSFYGDSPLYTFASLIDTAIRSSSASYEADYEPHSSTTTNLLFQELSLPDPHNNPCYQTLTQQTHVHHLPHHSNEVSSGVMRAQRMPWTTTLDSRFVHEPDLGTSPVYEVSSGIMREPRIWWTTTPPTHLKSFTFNELQNATRGFCPDGIVGRGSFVYVFKGWIDENTLNPTKPGTGMAIAVKRTDKKGRCSFGYVFKGWIDGKTLDPTKPGTGMAIVVKRNDQKGRVSFGSVFKGWIDEKTLAPTKPRTGMAIAVKRNDQEGRQRYSEWLTEIKYLGQLCHPNLVKLIGYASGTIHRSLVYEFMAKGSLHSHLHAASECETLSWTICMKVALDTAKALAFLHEVHLIYRDFKSSNILLDTNYNAKLSNFGLVINGAEEDEISTSLAGTVGYFDPAYFRTGLLSKKSDVYGFGVVLLELTSGKRVKGRYGPNGDDLVDGPNHSSSTEKGSLRSWILACFTNTQIEKQRE